MAHRRHHKKALFVLGLLENTELCLIDKLIGQIQNKNSWLIKSTPILDKEV